MIHSRFKRNRAVQAVYLAWSIITWQVQELREMWGRGVFCRVENCWALGEYTPRDKRLLVCKHHMTDEVLTVASDALAGVQARENAGEFLPEGQIIRSRGRMGPHELSVFGLEQGHDRKTRRLE